MEQRIFFLWSVAVHFSVFSLAAEKCWKSEAHRCYIDRLVTSSSYKKKSEKGSTNTQLIIIQHVSQDSASAIVNRLQFQRCEMPRYTFPNFITNFIANLWGALQASR
jgi:hypothetical protein